MSQTKDRLLTVSNRGPYEYHMDESGQVLAVPGQGGLSTALRAAASLAPAIWLSSPLTAIDRDIADRKVTPPESDAISHFVSTDPDAYELFYGTFANEVLWFLQHALPWPEELTPGRIDLAWHEGYLAVNEAFADAVVDELDAGVRAVMFHDYHFYAAPRLVRRRRPDAFLQQFIHIPWPGPSEWKRLDAPILRSVLDGLLANDSLVFQTETDAHNFLLTVQANLPAMDVDLDTGMVEGIENTTRVWANGISVDDEELMAEKATPEFARYRYLMRSPEGMRMILRVDRLDPTKNVIRGFQAYERMFETHPSLIGRVQFVALLVPSKSSIAVYQRYQEEAVALAESINQRLGTKLWKPIRLIYEHNRVQALAAMSLYDVLLVNPLADGMNLVAKEGPTLNPHFGALVLSKRAGAYEELKVGAIGIDPEDVDETAEALYQALTMPAVERCERAEAIRRVIRQHDLRHWFSTLLADIDANAPVPVVTAA